jgi:hypothetical protein
LDQNSLPRPELLVDPKDQEQKNLVHKPGKKEIKEKSNEDEIRDEDTEKNEGPRLLQIG